MKALKKTDLMTSEDISGQQAKGGSPDQKVAGEVSQPARHQMIAEAAYYLAECRGFESGCELDDWLAAEAEIDNGYFADAKVSPPRRAGRKP
ncbi:MAG: DUF2934 domain-containing protein [Gammaproteobacteria bacterium]|nr:DUF2934 domain-containing protein [Gammaproteobacteria bacterium]